MPIATNYKIKNTQGTLSFDVNVGKVVGPSLDASQAYSYDLTFYGYGRVGWGQEVDQNFFRLLENFACEQADAHQPKTRTDLGGISGVNKPVVGQLWYNLSPYDTTTNPGGQELHICTSVTPGVGSTPSVGVWKQLISSQYADDRYLSKNDAQSGFVTYTDGDLRYLKISDAATTYVAIAGSTMTGLLTLSGNPVNANHAATKSYADSGDSSTLSSANAYTDGKITTVNTSISNINTSLGNIPADYVNVSGDTMTGGLSVRGSANSGYSSTAAAVTMSVSGGTAYMEIGNRSSVATNPYIDFHSSGNSTVDYDSRIIASGGNTTTGKGTLQLIGNVVSDGRTPTLDNQFVTKKWVTDTIATSISGSADNTSYLPTTGGTMSGAIAMGTKKITNLGAPSASTDAATLGSIKSNAYGPSGNSFSHQIFISSSQPAGGANGDIWIVI